MKIGNNNQKQFWRDNIRASALIVIALLVAVVLVSGCSSSNNDVNEGGNSYVPTISVDLNRSTVNEQANEQSPTFPSETQTEPSQSTSTCTVCSGDGWIECPTCFGSGYLEDGTECPACGGTGGHFCDECGGDGNRKLNYLEIQLQG